MYPTTNSQQLQPPPPDTSSSASATAIKRPRLKGAGVQILEDFVKTHGIGVVPNRQERQVLLKQVRALPEYHDYSASKLRQWFDRRLKQHEGQQQKPVNQEASSSSFPHLTAQNLADLQVLYENAKDLNQLPVDTWARLIQKPLKEVKAWALYHQNIVRGGQTDWRPPTPRNTTSPEPPSPADSYFSGDKEDPLYSPHISYASPQLPTAPAPVSLQNSTDSIRQSLLHVIAETDLDPDAVPLSAATRLPSSAEEFNAMFEPYNKTFRKLETFLDCYLPAP